MNGHSRRFRKFLDQSFERFQKLPEPHARPAWERLLDRRRDNLEGVFEGAEFAADSIRLKPPVSMRRPLWAAVAAALVVAAVLPIAYWPAAPAPALVQSVEGGLHRVVGGKTQVLQLGEKIAMGDIVRSNGGSGGTLVLADGSRVEMRTKSELFFERADDGIRIRLSNGSIVVNAAKQRAGHLYVQTKDVMVSVVGTVFVVNAEEEGSRVAVYEGEVHVQQGARETKLRPGEQVASNPKMETLSVTEEVAWSREAVSHVALLQGAARIPAPQTPKEERVAFEEATIRPAAPRQAVTGPQARGGGGNGHLECSPNRPPLGAVVQLDPRRFSIRDVSLQELIAMAHGRCGDLVRLNRLSGGPAWIKSEMWDIEALIPEGAVNPLPTGFNGPAGELWEGRSPKVQKMLRTLLEERFGIVFRRETKEVPVYLLTVAPGGPKFNGDDPRFKRPEPDSRGPVFVTRGAPASSVTPNLNTTIGRQGLVTVAEGGEVNMVQLSMTCNGQPCGAAWFGNQTISQVIGTVTGFLAGRPVLDRTGITDKVSFTLEWPRVPAPYVEGQLQGLPSFQDLSKALEKVGLQLKEDPKGVLETLVIERAEKPSEN